jgi:hypothetical protein
MSAGRLSLMAKYSLADGAVSPCVGGRHRRISTSRYGIHTGEHIALRAGEDYPGDSVRTGGAMGISGNDLA